MCNTHLDTDTILSIINNADMEDVVIFNENYERLVNDMPDGEEKTKYVWLKSVANKRLSELANG